MDVPSGIPFSGEYMQNRKQHTRIVSNMQLTLNTGVAPVTLFQALIPDMVEVRGWEQPQNTS